jgi:hypothetical protein
VTCEAATPWVEKQQTTEPHALHSSEQVCLRVWGWAGHGSCAVGWGRVVPSNPFSVPSALEAKSFCLQLSFTGIGSHCLSERLV